MSDPESPTSEARRYDCRAQWSAPDEAFIGTVSEFRSLSWVAGTQDEALAGIRSLLAATLGELTDNGEVAPAPHSSTNPGT